MDDESSYDDTISEAPEDDVEFYLRFIKPLILKLPHARDRSQAAAWAVKIMRDRRTKEKVKTDYLKLLLMNLHRGHLVGIFTKDPQEIFDLAGFPDNLELHEYARRQLQREIRDRKERIKRQLRGKIDIPPYYTDYSVDLREYVALQDIPGFGVHCYYAISKDPLEYWNKSEKAIIPKRTSNAFDILDPPKRASQQYLDYERCCCAMHCDIREPSQKKKQLTKWGLRPPILPMGIYPPKEERKPPAWGSNLINVFDEPFSEPETEEEILTLTTELKKLHQFLEEYETGTLKTTLPKLPTPILETLEEVLEDKEEIVESHVDVDNGEEESPQMAEIKEQAYLTDYLKYKAHQTAVQQRILRRSQEVQASIPAGAFVPISTPKQSPLPLRRPTTPMVSEECAQEEPSRFISFYLNNDAESARIDEELAKWVQRLEKLEGECAELAKQTCKKCKVHHIGSCGGPCRK